MAKIGPRKRLARGTELLPEHLASPADAVSKSLNNAQVAVDQRETAYSTFSVSLNFPWLESKYFFDNDPKGNAPYYMSFCLPPVQDLFPADTTEAFNGDTTNPATKMPILESLSFSFDQRDAPAATVSHWYGTSKISLDGSNNAIDTEHYHYTDQHAQFEPNPYEGFLAYNRLDGLDIKLSVYSKPQVYFSLDDSAESGAKAVDTLASDGAGGANITTTAGHLLAVGDLIYLYNGDSAPGNINGLHRVTAVLMSTMFKIAVDVSTTHTDQGSYFKVSQHSPTSEVMDEVISYEIPGGNFASPGLNPLTITDINKAFSPFKTYVLAIHAPGLHDDRDCHSSSTTLSTKQDLEVEWASHSVSDKSFRLNEHLALLSVWVTLNFKMEMDSRDIQNDGDTAVQNMPTHDGDKTSQGLSDVAPSQGTNITADTASGTSTRIQTIDKVFEDKLVGGYDGFGGTYPFEHLKEDAGYEVITVPLMQGFPGNQLVPAESWSSLAYGTGAGEAYIDRRIIPLTSPLTLHHATSCLNFLGAKVATSVTATSSSYSPPVTVVPSSPRNSSVVTYSDGQFPQVRGTKSLFRYQIGVALVTGHAADNMDYQQLAYVDYDPSIELLDTQYGSPYLIDTVDMRMSALKPGDLAHKKPFEQALISVPLWAGAQVGKGFWGNGVPGTRGVQGAPIFMGEAFRYMGTGLRSDISDDNDRSDALSAVKGMEQYIEVRMAVVPNVTATVNGITVADPGVFTTTAAHNFETGDTISFDSTIITVPAVRNSYFKIVVLNATTFYLQDSAGDAIEITVESVEDGVATCYGQPSDIAVGYGGNFVYLICKKHLRG